MAIYLSSCMYLVSLVYLFMLFYVVGNHAWLAFNSLNCPQSQMSPGLFGTSWWSNFQSGHSAEVHREGGGVSSAEETGALTAERCKVSNTGHRHCARQSVSQTDSRLQLSQRKRASRLNLSCPCSHNVIFIFILKWESNRFVRCLNPRCRPLLTLSPGLDPSDSSLSHHRLKEPAGRCSDVPRNIPSREVLRTLLDRFRARTGGQRSRCGRAQLS